MEQNVKKGGFKNFWIYILFNFIYGFLLPLGIILLDFLWVKAQGNEKATTFQIIVFGIEALTLLIIKEYLVCKTAKKAANSSYLMSKFAFAFSMMGILIITSLLFKSTGYGFKAKYLVSFVYGTCVTLMIIRFFAYIIAMKFALKEKIEYRKYIITGFISYLLLISISFNLIVPSTINKLLFKTFGQTEFSSKDVKVILTDYYNDKCGTISYLHKFKSNEFECFENVTFEVNVTSNDINKLSNLNNLTIKNISIDENLNLSKNEKLVYLSLENTKIKELNSSDLGYVSRLNLKNNNINNFNINSGSLENVYGKDNSFSNLNVSGNSIKDIVLEKSNIENLSISNTTKLTNVKIEKSKIEKAILDNIKKSSLSNSSNYLDRINISLSEIGDIDFKNYNNIAELINNSNIIFKTMSFDNKKLYLENNKLLKISNSILYVPEKTKVKELILENMTAIVKDHYHDLIGCDNSGMCTYDGDEKIKIQSLDSTLSDHIELYDGNNKIFEWLVFDYKDGEL